MNDANTTVRAIVNDRIVANGERLRTGAIAKAAGVKPAAALAVLHAMEAEGELQSVDFGTNGAAHLPGTKRGANDLRWERNPG